MAVAYVIVTCGALIASTHRVVRRFGMLNLAGVVVVLLVRGYAFTSVWGLYAAVLSLMLYRQFSGRHIGVARPNGSLAAAA